MQAAKNGLRPRASKRSSSTNACIELAGLVASRLPADHPPAFRSCFNSAARAWRFVMTTTFRFTPDQHWPAADDVVRRKPRVTTFVAASCSLLFSLRCHGLEVLAMHVAVALPRLGNLTADRADLGNVDRQLRPDCQSHLAAGVLRACVAAPFAWVTFSRACPLPEISFP
jgi:hypothetical protein